MRNFMAVDQYGQTEHNLGPHPRKELLKRAGRRSARRIFQDTKSGTVVHVGWIIAGSWWTVYEVTPMRKVE